MGFIEIDYDTLLQVTVLAFAAIGFSRGWLAELINTILLLLLSVLLIKPEMLESILEKLNEIVKLLMAMLESHFDFGEAIIIFNDMEDVIAPSNPYAFLLLATIVFLGIINLGTGLKLTGDRTPFSRILGAVFGAVNAFIVISLGKELPQRFFGEVKTQLANGQISIQAQAMVNAQVQSAQALAPSGVVIALQDAPVDLLPKYYLGWIIFAVLAIGGVVLASHLTNKPIGTP